MIGPKNIFIRIKGSIAAEIMAQKYFDLKRKCDELEARNTELEAENQALKEKVSDLAFEVVLLKEVCDYDEDDKKDEIIASLEAELADTKEELANLNLLFNGNVTRKDLDDLTENLVDVFNDQPDTKMGEDKGENPKKDVKKAAKKAVKKVVKKANTRSYVKKTIKVTDPHVLRVLKSVRLNEALKERNPEVGHTFTHTNVRYAKYYGRLNKAWDIGQLNTIILSSEGKVYQIEEKDKYFELMWQTNKAMKKPSYGSIRLLGEGKNYMCNILNAFKTELSLYL